MINRNLFWYIIVALTLLLIILPGFNIIENFTCNPYHYRTLPWFNRFLFYPYLRPAYYRNYGEILDPYYPKYFQTYYNDAKYYVH